MASSDSEGESFEVAEVLDVRKRGRATEYLVRWKGFTSKDSSWEPTKNLKKSKDLIDAYTKKGKAAAKSPARTKSPGRPARGQGEGGKAAAKTRTTTKTTTVRTSMSSPESSPVLSRRSMKTETVTTIDSRGRRTTTTKVSGGHYKFNPLHLTKCDIPIVILVCCLLLIASTFVFEHLKKTRRI